MKFLFLVFLLIAVTCASHEKNGRPLLGRPGHGVLKTGSGERRSSSEESLKGGRRGNKIRHSVGVSRPGNTYDNWQDQRLYKYNVEVRTLTAMTTNDQTMCSKWAGVQYKAKLALHKVNQGKFDKSRLRGQITGFIYGHVHDFLPQGWEAPLSKLQYVPYQGMDRTFEVEMSGGLVKNIWVPQDTTVHQENLIKAILNGLQYDTSHRKLLGNNGFLDDATANGVYKKMESEITGKCEVMYGVNMIPLDLIHNNPQLAPIVKINMISRENKQRYVDIVKTRNFNNCYRRQAYHFGVPEEGNWENPAGKFLGRSTVTRIIADLFNNTIYSSYGTDQVRGSPVTDNEDHGMVMTSANMTLVALEDLKKPLNPPKDSRSAGNLIFTPIKQLKPTPRHGGDSNINNVPRSPSQHVPPQQVPGNIHVHPQKGHGNVRARRSAVPVVGNFANRLAKDEAHFQSRPSRNRGDSTSSSEERFQQKLRSRPSSSSTSSSNECDECEDNGVNDFEPWIPLPSLETEESVLPALYSKPIHKSPEDIAKYMQEVASELQQPNQMPNVDTLGKINFVTSYISTMAVRELDATAKLLRPQDKNDKIKNTAWKMYLDAVAHAGTNSAYAHIKRLILNDVIHGEQAAQLVAVLPRTLRNPTKQLLTDFFNMGFDNKVRNQKYLNTTILLASTSLINNAAVNNRSAHDFYPTHMYGKFVSRQQKKELYQATLQTLEHELRSAVEKKDGHKIQVLVRAIGNIGHPGILDIFQPYITGRTPVTTYQRMSMVMAMDRLASLYPEIARYVLFNIYSNKGGRYEVRVAAIFELLRANPTLHMFQQMARATGNDPSIQVRAAIKTAFRHAAKLDTKEPQLQRLSRLAKSVQSMLSNTEYGFQYSAKYLDYYFSKNLDAGHFATLGLIGSKDSIVHKYFSLYSRLNYGGWLNPKKVQGGVSSVSKLVQLIKNKLGQPGQSGQQSVQLTGQDIKQVLEIKDEIQDQLEGNLIIKLLNQERIFTLEEYQINNLPQKLRELNENLQKGIEYNYNKFLNKETVDIMFPTLGGMQFFLNSRVPVYIQLQGKIQGKVNLQHNNQQVAVGLGLHFVFAQDHHTRVGFYCPMGEKYMSSGSLQKQQLNIPLSATIKLDLPKNEFSLATQPLKLNEKTLLAYKTLKTYTSVREATSMSPASQHKETHYIKSTSPRTQFNQWYGKETTGMAVNVQIVSNRDKPRYKTASERAQEGLLAVFYPLIGDKGGNNEMLVAFDPQQSTNDKLEFNLRYVSGKASSEDQWVSSEQITNHLIKNAQAQGQAHSQVVLQAATSGISNSKNRMLDVTVVFKGKTPADFTLSVADSEEEIGEKSRMVISYRQLLANRKPFQLKGVVTSLYPTVPTLDFLKALEQDTKWQFDAKFRFGEELLTGSIVNIEGIMRQTQERKEYLKNTPIAKLCQQQMQKGNILLPACKNATIQANMMDALNMKIQYRNIGNRLKQFVSQTYNTLRYHYYYNINEDWFNVDQQPGLITVDSQLSLDLSRLNAFINAPVCKISVTNLKLNRLTRTILARNPVVPIYKQVTAQVFGNQFRPTCAIDATMINSFANHTYPYTIGNCWHVAMMKGVQQKTSETYALVLVKRNQAQEGVYVEYQTSSGENVGLVFENGQMKVNEKPINLQAELPYVVLNKDQTSELLNVGYAITGELRIKVGNGDVRVASQNGRVRIEVADSFRNKTQGLCGDNSGNKLLDLLTPAKCNMQNEGLFGATWVYNTGNTCKDPTVLALAEKAKSEECVPPGVIRPHIQPPAHAGVPQPRPQRKKNKKVYESKGRCRLIELHQGYVDEDYVCITSKPLPACSPSCERVNLQDVEAEVVCQGPSDPEYKQFQKHLETLEKGIDVHIDPSKYPDKDTASYRVPQGCK